MPVNFGGPGVLPSLGSLDSNVISLPAGAVWLIPSGRWQTKPGKYTVIQEYDPVAQFWRTIGGGSVGGSMERIVSDGANYRLANQTGCVVGALITNGGSAYTSAPTVTATGGSLWRGIIGGAVSTSVTVSNGGSNYTYPPSVWFPPPPPGGIQATGHCTLSSGAVSTVVIDDQGAGYATAPVPIFVNDPREGVNGVTMGAGAAAVTSLTGSGTLTGLICIDHGLPQTSVPSLAITGGGGSSAAATAIMCWTVTAYAVSNSGTGATGNVIITVFDTFPSTSPAYTNVTTQKQLVKTRNASILAGLTTTVGNVTTAGAIVYDGGIFTAVPTVYTTTSNAAAGSTEPVLTFTCGGQTDISIIQPT